MPRGGESERNGGINDSGFVKRAVLATALLAAPLLRLLVGAAALADELVSGRGMVDLAVLLRLQPTLIEVAA
jgi:hypothetical protein